MRRSLQQRVAAWMLDCFGPVIPFDKVERNHRFFEESAELVQSLGMTRADAHRLVDYVYDRPIGDPFQEIGGVNVTLLALCEANGMHNSFAADMEIQRITRPQIMSKIRAKQETKPKHSPLPESV